MTRGFAALTAALTATIGVLVGAILAGTFVPSTAVSAPAAPAAMPASAASLPVLRAAAPPALGFPTSFADVAARANPAVVSIDVASRSRRRPAGSPPAGEGGFGFRRPETPRRGTGTGFIVDPAGVILTNQHVVDGAERVMVKLADGRSFKAAIIGAEELGDEAVYGGGMWWRK